ncbi:MAG: universal stress protein [Actinomycetota bacterium]
MKVLYTTNGQLPARKAGELLKALARTQNIEITVLCVNTEEYLLPDGSFRPGEDNPTGTAAAEELLAETAEYFRGHGFSVEISLSAGTPAQEIVRITDEGQFDLCVLGAGNQNWLGRFLLGSTSTAVVHATQTPVLVVHEDPVMKDTLSVIVATDGSDYSTSAIDTFCALADPDKCSVLAISVVQPAGTPVLEIGGSYFTRPLTEDQMLDLEALAQADVDKAIEQLRAAGFEATGRVLVGTAGTELLHAADSEEADLVVAGSRGLGAFARVAVGSTSDQLVRHARATLLGSKDA